MQPEAQSPRNWIIVGGGAAGIELATRLGKKFRGHPTIKIILVDPKFKHIWKPQWHEIAAGTLNYPESEVNYLLHGQRYGYQFELGAMERLIRAKQQIILAPMFDEQGQLMIERRALPYERLFLAVGSISHDFSVPGVAQYSDTLDSQQQADQFYRRFLQQCIRRQYQPTNTPFKIVIVGGGATGVELAAELTETIRRLQQLNWTHIDPSQMHISLVEGAERLLPNLPQRVSQAIEANLVQQNIKVYLNHAVARLTQDCVYMVNGEVLPADMIVWAAGIKAPEWLAHLGLAHNKLNQIMVKPTLQTQSDPQIFALGDAACCILPDYPQGVPPRAQAAHQQAALLAKSLHCATLGKPLLNYHYRDYGSLISLSQRTAVGHLGANVLPGGIFLEGKLAQWFYWLLFKKHQMVLFGFWRVALGTLGQLLLGKIKLRVKLH
jgi:NADH dehydrogenase